MDFVTQLLYAIFWLLIITEYQLYFYGFTLYTSHFTLNTITSAIEKLFLLKVDQSPLKKYAVSIFLADLQNFFCKKKSFFGHSNQLQTKFMVV